MAIRVLSSQISGSHFKKHCDTQKFPGMFATLVIQLPSEFQGGEISIHHDGRVASYAFAKSNTSYDAFFYCFYSDVEHEIGKVTQGCRLALVQIII